VLRVGAVTIEDSGHLAGPAGAPGGTLTELGARLGGDAYLGHGENSSSNKSWSVLIRYSTHESASKIIGARPAAYGTVQHSVGRTQSQESSRYAVCKPHRAK
jgi:hypothetical protein